MNEAQKKISRKQTKVYTDDWKSKMKGEKALLGSNPMPKTFNSDSHFAGSNATFSDHTQGTLGTRYWQT